MTHLAVAADRIDRPYSPWGGREGRELDIDSKNGKWRNTHDLQLLQARVPLSIHCMLDIIRFLDVIAIKNSHDISTSIDVPGSTNPCAKL